MEMGPHENTNPSNFPNDAEVGVRVEVRAHTIRGSTSQNPYESKS